MQDQRRKQIGYILTQAFAYLFGGVFLVTFKDAVLTDWLLPTLGYIFVATAIFLVVSPFNDLLVRWANRIDYYLSGGLIVVTLALLVKTFIDVMTSGFMLLSVLVIIWTFLLYAILIFRIRRLR